MTQPLQGLDVFLRPSSVALVGASEKSGTVGAALLANLSGMREREFYPVNPKFPGGFATLQDIPGTVDLAVIATPAPTVPGIVRDCVEKGVKGAIVISAGFREAGDEGARLEREIQGIAKGKLRIVGPNCVGVMSPWTGLNATFANAMARPGNVGFLSQSGALLTSILDWSLQESVGFSAFVSTGSMLDAGWGDWIEHLNEDPRTKSIIVYMESVGDARSFLSAAREATLNKPVIVLKPGRSEAAAKAAASHTGALTGSDEVLDAAFRRCGVLRVDTIAELFYMAEVLSKQPRPRGPRLTIVTNAGGPAVLAADALIGAGGELASLSPETMRALDGVLPAHWSHNNPVDIIGDAGADRYASALEIAAKDPATDGLLVILTPQAVTDPASVAERLRKFAKLPGKPVLASWMGGADVAAGDAILTKAGIPTFPYPDTAARIFEKMWRHTDNLRELYETPSYVGGAAEGVRRAREIVDAARVKGRTLLTEEESKRLLAAYGLPTIPARVAASAEEAARSADEIGYPVVLKLHSETVTHKTDVGGVRLNLENPERVHEAFGMIQAGVPAADFLGVTVQPMIRRTGYELIVGSSLDSQFGPVLLFGAGGQLVEVLRDRSLGLPPLNTTLALRMIERTRIHKALLGIRGRKPVDLEALASLLVRFSRLVVEQRWIRDIEINPLLASEEGLLALDARVLLHRASNESEPPCPAIRPYPAEYATQWISRAGAPLRIRPIAPEDEPLMKTFHESLSPRSVYFRYFHMVSLERRIAHDQLTRRCFLDYDREIAFVAQGEDRSIAGVARLVKQRLVKESEFAVVVADSMQGQGLGVRLMEALLDFARREGHKAVHGEILSENTAMIAVCRKLGFSIEPGDEPGAVHARIELTPP